MTKIFIDGSAGTTGLRIYERIAARKDLVMIRIPEQFRKDPNARRDALNEADIAFLCLPDAASIEAVSLLESDTTAIIDTSTAHRTAEGWVYGFAEIGGRHDQIAASKRIANPGCHASGFISLAAPLVEAGILKADALLSCFSLTGYSGGGKKMILEYEEEPDELLSAPRMYGLPQVHKHLPEMAKISGLNQLPVFCPVVAPYYSGMQVTVPLFGEAIGCGIDTVKDVYRAYYQKGLVHFVDEVDEGGFLSACAFADRDDMQIYVCGNDERMTVVSRFDNLGKGASGSAIQNMNILLGLDDAAGLNV